MAMNKKPSFPFRGRMTATPFKTVDGVDPLEICDAGPQGAKVVGILASGEDTAARNISLALIVGSDTVVLNTVAVPAGAGKSAAVPPVDLLDGLRDRLPIDGDGQPYMFLSENESFRAMLDAAVTAAEILTVFVIYGTFDDETV